MIVVMNIKRYKKPLKKGFFNAFFFDKYLQIDLKNDRRFNEAIL